MYINRKQADVMAAFMEALLPESAFADVRARMGQIGNEIFEPQRFDDPYLVKSIPAVFSILYWLPIVCFWLTWVPLPFSRLSVRQRQRLFAKLEHSRLYALRGLYLTGKMFCCMVFFHDESTWGYVGYDGEGALSPVVNPTALDDLRAHDVA